MTQFGPEVLSSSTPDEGELRAKMAVYLQLEASWCQESEIPPFEDFQRYIKKNSQGEWELDFLAYNNREQTEAADWERMQDLVSFILCRVPLTEDPVSDDSLITQEALESRDNRAQQG